MAITFEGYERRIAQINKACEQYGIKDLEEALKLCTDRGFNPYDITTGIQSIAFENAKWAYTLGCAIALKKAEKGEVTTASEAAAAIGEGLQAFCVPGSVADGREGVAIMWHENVDISITGNSTNPTRFQHPVAGTYFKERVLAGKKYFSVASGGGTGRTLHPDNMAAGPASYGMTDTMGRMHSSAQFAGSSSVPAHVDMMGLIGMGNNPMVGCTVACAVAVEESLKK